MDGLIFGWEHLEVWTVEMAIRSCKEIIGGSVALLRGK